MANLTREQAEKMYTPEVVATMTFADESNPVVTTEQSTNVAPMIAPVPDMCIRISIDIETVSTANNAGIISIGAAIFDNANFDLNNQIFYEKIDVTSVEAAGFDISQTTMDWWGTQDIEVREEAFSGTKTITEVLNEFSNWINNFVSLGYTPILYSNGANFDGVILRNAYDHLGITVPFTFRNELCYRTITRMFPALFDSAQNFATNPAKHNALNDAIYQAMVLGYIFHELRISGELLWAK